MAATSRGCSTTQITDRSRRGSVQMAQGSASVMFPHTEHGRIRVLASRMAAARASTSCWFIVRMWKASRWAVFGPMVGNLVSSLISRARGGAEANISWSRPWTEEPGELQPAGHRLHTGRGEVPRLLQGVAGGCDHQILQHGDLLRVHDARVDGDREEVPLTIADGPDGPAPGRALDPLLRQLRLDSGQRFLHLLNLLEDPLHVVHEPLLEGLLETPDLLNGVPEPPHRLLHETTASVRALRRGGRRLRGGGGQDAAESETHPRVRARTSSTTLRFFASCRFSMWNRWRTPKTSSWPTSSWGALSRRKAWTARVRCFTPSITRPHWARMASIVTAGPLASLGPCGAGSSSACSRAPEALSAPRPRGEGEGAAAPPSPRDARGRFFSSLGDGAPASCCPPGDWPEGAGPPARTLSKASTRAVSPSTEGSTSGRDARRSASSSTTRGCVDARASASAPASTRSLCTMAGGVSRALWLRRRARRASLASTTVSGSLTTATMRRSRK